jgi:hypothetical protein
MRHHTAICVEGNVYMNAIDAWQQKQRGFTLISPLGEKMGETEAAGRSRQEGDNQRLTAGLP